MEQAIQVTYKTARTPYEANQLLKEIKQYNLFSADFEAAVKYTEKDLITLSTQLENEDLPKRKRIEYEAILKTTALDHPNHVTLTHCSIAINNHEAYVFILDKPKITDLILNFLITTPIKQIWHNASFDFKHIYYHTGKMPINYEDTQIFTKTILNHVETYKAKSGLKDLAGHRYGAWGISVDNFKLENIYEEHVHHYAAIDACATYYVWESIQKYVEEQSNVSILS